MPVSALGYFEVEVDDLERWKEFAENALGFAVQQDENGSYLCRYDLYEYRLVLREGPSNDISAIGWECASEQDLEETATRIRATGTEPVWATADECLGRKVRKMFHITDEIGIRTEFFCTPSVRRHDPFRSAQHRYGFKTDYLGAGHLLIFSERAERMVRFYVDTLGFRISDYERASPELPGYATFLHCNPRHHSIAFAPVGTPRKLHHFMLELEDIDDLGRTFDRVQDRPSVLATGFGRHPNDGMLSFYLNTPSGFQIECGVNGKEIDDASWRTEQHDAISSWGHRPVTVE